MSLLHQEPGEEIDDAARGEAFTRGSSHVVWASVVATVLVAAIVAIYVIAGQKPPVASGEIVQVWAHPLHVVTSGFDANGEAMARQSVDQVLILAHVKLRNQSNAPLYLEDVLANVSQGDATLHVSAGDAAQYDALFVAYPELAALRAKAVSPRTMIAPGQSLDGDAFWVTRMSRQEWDARHGLNFTFRFQYQSSLALAPHTPVIEQ